MQDCVRNERISSLRWAHELICDEKRTALKHQTRPAFRPVDSDTFRLRQAGLHGEAVGGQIRDWHLRSRSGTDRSGLAEEMNPQVRG